MNYFGELLENTYLQNLIVISKYYGCVWQVLCKNYETTQR